jgi:hypothetical protein
LLALPGVEEKSASNAMATTANAATMQNAETNPLEVDGFDKVILLMMNGETPTGEITLGKTWRRNHSAPEPARIFSIFGQLVCEYRLEPLGCQRTEDSNSDTTCGKLR